MNTTAVRKIDELNREVWGLQVHLNSTSLTVTVSSYAIEARPSTRHKFKAVKSWSSAGRKRGYGEVAHRDVLNTEEVPSPPIEAVALALWDSQVTVKSVGVSYYGEDPGALTATLGHIVSKA